MALTFLKIRVSNIWCFFFQFEEPVPSDPRVVSEGEDFVDVGDGNDEGEEEGGDCSCRNILE